MMGLESLRIITYSFKKPACNQLGYNSLIKFPLLKFLYNTFNLILFFSAVLSLGSF